MPMDALTDGCVAFGARLRVLRRSKGMSMRALTGLIGLSAHSNLADYECGRRLPPRDVLEACERVLGVADRELFRLWEAALRERSERDSTVDAGRRVGWDLKHGGPVVLGPLANARRSLARVMLPAVAVVAVLAGWALRSATAPSLSDGPVQVVNGVSSCHTTARIVDSVGVTTEPRPGWPPQTVGTVSLRFSPSCGLAWTRFVPARPATPSAVDVELSVHRVADGATTVLRLSQVVGAESDPLLTVPGCVYAQVSVSFVDGTVATGRTGCRTG
jgi:transcriptional regulator with XRE-family HTH domain